MIKKLLLLTILMLLAFSSVLCPGKDAKKTHVEDHAQDAATHSDSTHSEEAEASHQEGAAAEATEEGTVAPSGKTQ